MLDLGPFLDALARLPDGHSEGSHAGAPWRATVNRSPDGRRVWLLAEALGGPGLVGFNLYTTATGPQLKPCEMPAQTVIDFVLGYLPDH